ncbi:hypothetical protein HPB47_006658 [Ixodes persulcatus]|uniref:Uncharacterized protein n=1 Tax=Ixodes persulcatus TaxID=34615 RepID=A0AC60P9K4_IXOPE|nr:hypothetical protein HPB47_006658 [Ixodes persulcatus]
MGVATRYGNLAVLTEPSRDIYLRETKALILAALIAPPQTIILCDNEAVVAASKRSSRRQRTWIALQARASYYQRHPGVVASTLLHDDIGAHTRDIRDIIRDVVREELRKPLPAAERPASLSVAEIVRDEVQRVLQPEPPVDVPAPEEPTLSYAAIARRPPPVARQYQASSRRDHPTSQNPRRQEQVQHVRPERPSPRKTDVWRTADRRPLCFHCGEADHVYRRCPYRQLGLRGFHPDDPRPRYGERPRDIDEYLRRSPSPGPPSKSYPREMLYLKLRKIMSLVHSPCSYKASNTVKFLTVIAPNGLIMYVSRAYGGRASDKHIVRDCGVQEFFQRGDEIMADRGFTLDSYLEVQGVKLNMPAFTKGEVISSVPQHQFYIDNNIVQGSLATSRWIDGGQDYSDSLNLTRASTDFGRCDLPLYEHWSGNAVVYNLQKADSPSLLLGRGAGAAMTVPFTKFLLLTQVYFPDSKKLVVREEAVLKESPSHIRIMDNLTPQMKRLLWLTKTKREPSAAYGFGTDSSLGQAGSEPRDIPVSPTSRNRRGARWTQDVQPLQWVRREVDKTVGKHRVSACSRRCDGEIKELAVSGHRPPDRRRWIDETGGRYQLYHCRRRYDEDPRKLAGKWPSRVDVGQGWWEGLRTFSKQATFEMRQPGGRFFCSYALRVMSVTRANAKKGEAVQSTSEVREDRQPDMNDNSMHFQREMMKMESSN